MRDPLLILLLLSMSLMACNRKMIPTQETYLVDSVAVRYVEKLRFDTAYLPGQKVTVTDTMECPELVGGDGGALVRGTRTKASGLVGGTRTKAVGLVGGTPTKKLVRQKADSKGGVTLRTNIYNDGSFTTECETDSLMHVIAVKDTELVDLRKSKAVQVITKTEVKVKYRIPLWVWLVMAGQLLFAFRKEIVPFLINRIPWI